MALTVVNLATSASQSDATSYATASIAPAADALLLLFCTSEQASGVVPPTPAPTGNGLTWVQEEVCYFDQPGGVTKKLWAFRAMGAAPSAGAVTIAMDALSLGCCWSVVQVAGADTAGTNGSGAIVQKAKSAEPAAAAATSATATLGAAISGDNRPVAAGAWVASEAPVDVGGWTQVAASSHTTPPQALASFWNDANTDPSASLTWTTSSLAGLIVVEVKAAAVAAAATRRGQTVWLD